MKAVVSSVGEGLDADVSRIFGRCSYFVLVDTETMEASSSPNAGVNASGGAGIQAAEFVSRQGAQAVLSGNVGPNAMGVLRAAGISFYSVQGGTVREAVEALKNGQLQEVGGATVPSDFGKGGRGMGRGRGGGRGMGRGRNR